jgi:hypothetical protein
VQNLWNIQVFTYAYQEICILGVLIPNSENLQFMTLKELREWDERHPNQFVIILFTDASKKIGILKNMYLGDPQYPGGGVQTEDYFELEEKLIITAYRVSSIDTIKAV